MWEAGEIVFYGNRVYCHTELFLSLIHSLTQNHLGVHYLPGTGLGAKVRERKLGGRKLALTELKSLQQKPDI